MEIIIHRVNTISSLREIDNKYGTEIDIRTFGSDLILNHQPYEDGDSLIDYLDAYSHGTLILNIKEDGIENDVISLVKERSKITSYFLLDIEASYLYKASQTDEKNIAIRFSETESIETVKNFVGKLNWVWIDTNTRLPINGRNINILNSFKKCLVCPERWGRPKDIIKYKKIMDSLSFNVDSVMTAIEFINLWEN